MKSNLFRISELVLLAAIVAILIIGQFEDSEDSNDQPTIHSDSITNLVQWPVEQGGNGHWYGVLTKELFWEQANTLAPTLEVEGQTGYLATITTWAENEFIRNRIIAFTHQPCILDAFWLGGRYIDDQWQWINAEPFSVEFWSHDEPNNMKVETALSIWGHNNSDNRVQDGRWNNLLPDSKVNRVHRIWSVIEWGEPDKDIGAPKIDTLFNLIQWRRDDGGNDHWYAILALDRYFNEAMLAAQNVSHQNQSGYLATITSPQENDFILNKVIANMRQPSLMDEYWLGGQYVDSIWSWITSESMDFQNWAPGEPNNLNIETAISIWGPYCSGKRRIPGTWNNALPDSTVNNLSHFWSIVEFDPNPPTE